MNPTTYLPPYGSAFIRNSPYGLGPDTPLKKAIMGRVNGSIDYSGYDPIIRCSYHSLTGAIESAFVLVPREALPKVKSIEPRYFGRQFYFVDGRNSITADSGYTSAQARKQASSYLAVAAHLEAEENAAAAEAKRKADEDKAALEAEALRDRLNRLEELATEWFGEPYDYLGAKKKAAVEEIYRLERELDADDVCDECAA